ncbi:MAG TPA: 6-phosphogluconolactonase [Allosphingosinicella sp.]|nr:6-phosphogluconolactonase [Allosphingosinicella sp.]
MDEIEWWEFASQAELAEQAAGDIGFIIESAVQAHGGARLALAGGPKRDHIYAALVKQDLDWAKVTVIPTDDRLVGHDEEISMYRQLGRHFTPVGATVIPLVDESALGDYREAGRLADQRLKLVQWPLDLVLLGMAYDGHTASIFPGPDFDRAVDGPKERRAIGVRPDPMPDFAAVERVTLTTPALASARAAMVAIAGDHKRALLERAIAEGPLSSLPIGRVIAAFDIPIDIFWSAAE